MKQKTSPTAGTGGKSKEEHIQTAIAFKQMCSVFDEFSKYLDRSMALHEYDSQGGSKVLQPPLEKKDELYLHTVFKVWIQTYAGFPQSTIRSLQPGYQHQLMNKLGDGRFDLPKWLKRIFYKWGKDKPDCLTFRMAFFQSLPEKLKDCKITVWWMVAYINNIMPDETKSGWNKFECSHRCIQKCLTSTCLCWENKVDNQSRNNPACTKLCHCGCKKGVCDANNAHFPYCL